MPVSLQRIALFLCLYRIILYGLVFVLLVAYWYYLHLRHRGHQNRLPSFTVRMASGFDGLCTLTYKDINKTWRDFCSQTLGQLHPPVLSTACSLPTTRRGGRRWRSLGYPLPVNPVGLEFTLQTSAWAGTYMLC